MSDLAILERTIARKQFADGISRISELETLVSNFEVSPKRLELSETELLNLDKHERLLSVVPDWVESKHNPSSSGGLG